MLCAKCAKNKTMILIIIAALVLVVIGLAAFKTKFKKNIASSATVALSSPANPKNTLTPAVILLISEQNIEGPQRAWWASEIDLSAAESAVAQKIIQSGFTVLEPSQLTQVVKKSSAFRLLDIPDAESVKLGNLAQARYVIVGKAVASAGARVPQSNMQSCFANISAKIIRVKDGQVIAYLDAAGSTVHMDPITGGKEALSKAGSDLADKIINALKSDSAS
ncbi:MAG: hypothetical protein NC914_01915 [Candidatus Omnitrophica bacterium]|nr:hypothetical protein [Candidatus Omnitrophota bacterium]